MTTGLLLSKIASRCGYQVFDYIEYPSLIRGGHNAYEVAAGDDPISCLHDQIDILVCLNSETFNLHQARLADDALVVFDPEQFKPLLKNHWQGVAVPMGKMVSEGRGQPVMRNTVALGASIALMGGEMALVETILRDQFNKKGEAVIQFNIGFARQGYQHVKDHASGYGRSYLAAPQSAAQLVLSGNEAFALGAVVGDCRCYVAYPMTPASSVLTVLAAWQAQTGMVVRHAEDELAAINTAIGAGFAGARSAVGTSGGGFALMVETISLAGVSETPVVIFLAQRPGPATGMPTWTEQGDLLFAVHAGHGEFPKIVLAPGDVAEMVQLTAQAFNLADIYQLPVIVMSEMYLSESHATLSQTELDRIISDYQVKRGKTITKVDGSSYQRYKISPDGISERLIPGTADFYFQANSYEHKEDGHTSEAAADRVAQVDKRMRKLTTYLSQDYQLPTLYGDWQKAKTVLVGWGGIKGILLEVMRRLPDVAVMHFHHLYPLAADRLKPLLTQDKRYVLIENNATGQFGKLLLQEAGLAVGEKILRYDGRPLTVGEIMKKLSQSV